MNGEHVRNTLRAGKRTALVTGLLLLCANAFCALPPELDPANYAPNAKRPSRKIPTRTQPRPKAQPRLQPQKSEQRQVTPTPRVTAQTKAEDRPTSEDSIRPTPNVPLYLRCPAEQVVVGEISDEYVLTRRDLCRMAGTPTDIEKVLRKEKDPLMEEAMEGRIAEAEATALNDWAITKVFALAAKAASIKIPDSELEARIKEASEGLPIGSASGQNQTTALVVDPGALRAEMHDGLMADAFLVQQVQKIVPEQQLQAIYTSKPSEFMVPPRVHVWQIVRFLPENATKEVKADARKEFAKVRKMAAQANGENFEKVAREENAKNGEGASSGDLGWVDASTGLPPQLMETIARLKIGEVSDVIETESEDAPLSAKVTAGQVAMTQPRLNLPQTTTLRILRVTERSDAKGATYDDFARQRVLAYLVQDFRKKYGELYLHRAPFPVVLNPTGIRLVTEPRKVYPRPAAPVPTPVAFPPPAQGTAGNQR
jgi:hypothetical protein